MKKQTLFSVILASLFMLSIIPGVLSQTDRVKGDVTLVWNNYGQRPQNFTGNIAGDITGFMSIISDTTYDSQNPTVGLTDGDITALINGIECNGFYVGSNVDSGIDKGTFSLACDDIVYNGKLSGRAVQDSHGNYTLFNMKYDAFVINSKGVKGDKGDTGNDGIQGIQGIQGLPGTNGLNGKDGIDGINGQNGHDGLPGVQGIQGPKGDTGNTGPQGSNASIDLTPLTVRVSSIENFLALLNVYPGFNDFVLWLNSVDKCTNGAKQCNGNIAQTCSSYSWQNTSCQYGCLSGQCKSAPVVCTQGAKQCIGTISQTCNNNAWINTSCQYGCTSGICNNSPALDCNAKPHTFSCSNSYSVETGYYGSNNVCTSYAYYKKWCGSGCNTLTGLCK